MTAAAAAAPAHAGPMRRWRRVVETGLIGGVIAIYACLVGIVPVFHERPLVAGLISLGQAVMVLALSGTGFYAVRVGPRDVPAPLVGAVGGAICGSMVSGLVIVGELIDLRVVFDAASQRLYDVLTFDLGLTGAWLPTAAGAVLGSAAGAISVLPATIRRPLVGTLLALLLGGLFAGLIRTPMLRSPLADFARFLFAPEGLTLAGAAVVAIFTAASIHVPAQTRLDERIAELPEEKRRAISLPLIAVGIVLLILLPHAVGGFFAQVIALIAIYLLMGYGLNITLGLAGLLDLGFVAFFAIGAYTVGLLTSTAEFGIADWPFWAAIPFGVIAAMLFGAILGLPILGIRGDYLAIATLGFGEIIAILAGSDLLKPVLGGPRGIVNIPRPIDVPPDSLLAGPNQIYYLALLAAALVAFISLRLRASRLGRAWIAIREDEDVAEALGINLVQTKLLAYMLGAAFAGLGGALFASLIGAVFPSSINLFVSINVAAIIIIGGMGSIAGVALGAVFLIGIPELFREFSDYRFLFYGIALIAMMRMRPEGLIPAETVKRELHVDEENVEPAEGPIGSSVAQRAGDEENVEPAEGPIGSSVAQRAGDEEQ